MSESSNTASSEVNQPAGKRHRGLGRRILNAVKLPEYPNYNYAHEVVLPSSVRFALQHRGAELTRKNIEDLYRSGFPRAAFYLAIKSADAKTDTQTKMLQRFADKQFDYTKLTADDIQLGTLALDGQQGQPPRTVKGEKLGQLSRHGLSGELQAFDKSLAAGLSGHPQSPLFMVANYPYIALDVLAKHSLQKGNPLGVIIPEHLEQPTLSPGFLLEDHEGRTQVRQLDLGFQLPSDTIIFDDAIKEGTTREIVLAWAAKSTSTPTYISAAHYV